MSSVDYLTQTIATNYKSRFFDNNQSQGSNMSSNDTLQSSSKQTVVSQTKKPSILKKLITEQVKLKNNTIKNAEQESEKTSKMEIVETTPKQIKQIVVDVTKTQTESSSSSHKPKSKYILDDDDDDEPEDVLVSTTKLTQNSNTNTDEVSILQPVLTDQSPPEKQKSHFPPIVFPENFVDALVVAHAEIKTRTKQDMELNLTPENPHFKYYEYLNSGVSSAVMVNGNPIIIIDVMTQLLAKFESIILPSTSSSPKKVVDLTDTKSPKKNQPIISDDFVEILQFIKKCRDNIEEQEKKLRIETNSDQLRATQSKIDAQCLSSRPTSTIVALNENDQLAQQFSKITNLSMASLPSQDSITKNYQQLAEAFHNMNTSHSIQYTTHIDIDVFVKAFIAAKNADVIYIKYYNDYLDKHQIIDTSSIPDSSIKFLTDRTACGAEQLVGIIRTINLCTSFVILTLHYYQLLFFLTISGKFQGMGAVKSLRSKTGVSNYQEQDEDSADEKSVKKSKSVAVDNSDDDDENNKEEDSYEADKDKYDSQDLDEDDDMTSIVHQNDDEYTPSQTQESEEDDYDDAQSNSSSSDSDNDDDDSSKKKKKGKKVVEIVDDDDASNDS